MKPYQTIKINVNKGIVTVWLNRPNVHNAFNNVMIAEITDCFESLNNLSEIFAVILRGSGKSFCAGADLNWMRDVSKQTYEENQKTDRSQKTETEKTNSIVNGIMGKIKILATREITEKV